MKKKKLRVILKSIRSVVKPRTIIFLIILIAGNTYAWFVYSNKVSNSISAHVRAWNILFNTGDTTVSDYYYVNISEVYPGMEDFVDTLTASNESEVAANITYEILEARIFDETYVTVEGRSDAGEAADSNDMTSIELENSLANDYPFSITFSLTNENMSQTIGTSLYTTGLTWPFESGNDALDTYWGKEAYNYLRNNPDNPCISLRVKIYVTQAAEAIDPETDA